MKKAMFSVIILYAITGTIMAQPEMPYSAYERFLDFINKKIAAPLGIWKSTKKFGIPFNEIPLAPEEIQNMGTEAQKLLDIKPVQQVPIKQLPAKYHAAGLANAEAIYIKEEDLHGKPYGYKRFVVLHEHSHIKHYHPTKDMLLYPAVLSSLAGYHAIAGFRYYLGKSTSKSYLMRSWQFTGLLAVGSALMQRRMSKGNEWQADVDAAWHLNCADCLNEYVSEISDDHTNQGYLSTRECLAIAKTFQECNAKCQFHGIK